MRFFTSAALTLCAALAAVAQNTLTINTPTALFTCDPYLVAWSGGTGPYTVRVFPAGNIGTTPLATLVTGTSANTLTWTVNLAAGTGVTLAVTDATGTTIPSASVNIQAGSSTSCVGGDASTAASTGSAGATSAQSTSATSVATTLSSVTSQSAASSAASSVSSAASSVQSSATSAVSSIRSSIASQVSSATGGVAPSSTPASGAGSLALSGALGFAAVGLAVLA